MPQKYSHCVVCGKEKTTWAQRQSPKCRECFMRKDYYLECVDCGEPKVTRSQKNSPRCPECASIENAKNATKHTYYDHCVDCGKPKSRNIYPRCKPCSKKKLWEDLEYQEKQAAYRDDPEFIKKQRDSHVEIWADPEKRERQREAQKKAWSDPELKARHSETLSASYAEKYSDPLEYAAVCAKLDEFRAENWNDPEHCNMHKERMRNLWRGEEYREEMSQVVIDAWKSPGYREKRRQTWIERYGADEREYPIEFDYQLKEAIRDRDNRKCQVCGVKEGDCWDALSVHHIDYQRENLDPDNLVSLCRKCHGKTNGNRQYWIQVFTKYRHRQPKQDWQHRMVVTAEKEELSMAV